MADDPAPTPEGGKTLTQDQVDKIVESRLAREREKYSDYDDLKAQVEELKSAADAKAKEADKSKSESEKLAEQLQQLQSGLAEEKKAREKAELDSLRAKIASDKGVPTAFVSRLTGSNQEELEADADAIIEAIGGNDPSPDVKSGPGGRPKEKLTPGASGGGEETPDYQKMAEDIASFDSF